MIKARRRRLKGNRIMAIGPVNAGKSTLLQKLGLSERDVHKTESIEYSPLAVDTPGEAFEIPTLYHMLIMSSVKAALVLFLADPTKKKQFPAKFVHSLRAPTIGIITKIDVAAEDRITRTEKILKQSGVKTIFKISALTGDGIEELKSFIKGYQKDFEMLNNPAGSSE